MRISCCCSEMNPSVSTEQYFKDIEEKRIAQQELLDKILLEHPPQALDVDNWLHRQVEARGRSYHCEICNLSCTNLEDLMRHKASGWHDDVIRSSWKRIFVGNLNENITEDSLHRLFSPFGQIMDLEKPKTHYAMVCFLKEGDAAAAIEALHQTEFQEVKLNVTNAKFPDRKHMRQKRIKQKENQIKKGDGKEKPTVKTMAQPLPTPKQDDYILTEF